MILFRCNFLLVYVLNHAPVLNYVIWLGIWLISKL